MLFYVAVNQKGFRQVCKTQAEAKAIDKDFIQLDIPTDKDGLRDAVQELLTLVDAVVAQQSQEAEITPQRPQIEPQALPPAQTPLQFREMVENQWQNQPLAWRIDLMMQTAEECRKAVPWPPKSQPDV